MLDLEPYIVVIRHLMKLGDDISLVKEFTSLLQLCKCNIEIICKGSNYNNLELLNGIERLLGKDISDKYGNLICKISDELSSSKIVKDAANSLMKQKGFKTLINLLGELNLEIIKEFRREVNPSLISLYSDLKYCDSKDKISNCKKYFSAVKEVLPKVTQNKSNLVSSVINSIDLNNIEVQKVSNMVYCMDDIFNDINSYNYDMISEIVNLLSKSGNGIFTLMTDEGKVIYGAIGEFSFCIDSIKNRGIIDKDVVCIFQTRDMLYIFKYTDGSAVNCNIIDIVLKGLGSYLPESNASVVFNGFELSNGLLVPREIISCNMEA